MKEHLSKTLKVFKKKLNSLPRFSQWRNFPKVLSKKEKILFLFLLVCFFASSIILLRSFLFKKTRLIPKNGGTYIEGSIAQPRFINPILAANDIDRDIIEVLFSGLMKYDKNGKIILDLAKGYEIKEQGRVYEVSLKDNIFWHDGERLTADDIIFTIKTIQNPDYKSPEMANWIGVTIEKISDKKICFRLKNPYFPFLERLTLKILPKHILKEISPENLALISYNLQPVGSGPFKFKEIKYNDLGRIQELNLIKNTDYFGKPSYLDQISFHFFDTKDKLYQAFKRKEIQGLVTTDFKNIENLKSKSCVVNMGFVPRYFAIFFNPEKYTFFKDKEFRTALNLATNKKEIIKQAVANQARVVYSPILPEVYKFNKCAETSEFDLDKAEKLMKQAGFEKENGNLVKKETIQKFVFEKDLDFGDRNSEVEDLQTCLTNFPEIYPESVVSGYFGKSTEKAVIRFQEKYREEILDPWNFEKGTGIVAKTTREKLNQVCNSISKDSEPITISLVTINQPFLVKTAETLKKQWQKLGINVEIQSLDFNELSRDFIKPREYEMLLFGEALNAIPDPFPFWHSSRTRDPGLNLAIYKNEKSDTYLEKAREAQTFESLKENLEKFQDTIVEDKPAVFLYSPDFIYITSKSIKGINLSLLVEPSKRFINIQDWYIKTHRVF